MIWLRISGVAIAFTHKDMCPKLLDEAAFLLARQNVAFVGQVIGISKGFIEEIAEQRSIAVLVECNEKGIKRTNYLVNIKDVVTVGSF